MELAPHDIIATTTAVGGEVAHTAREGGIHVALAAERLGTFIGIPITNTLVTSWVVMVVLIGLAFFVRRSLSVRPGNLQLVFEELITAVHTFIRDTLESDSQARRFLPLLLTLFLFIFVSNALEFLPGIGSLGFYRGEEFVPLLRSVNTDLNVTLALTVIAVVVIEVSGVMALGFFKYTSKFLNFSSPVNFFVGFVELVSEVARLVSFSFRLFGNIFAGEVLIGVVSYFVPYILPSGLMAFELFVGFVQAAIFTLLTLFFIKLATTDVEHAH
ncbi:MAG: F0F1 ATP synthase subunit A [Patescibacteria group bacterium]